MASLSDLIDDASIKELLERQSDGSLTARALTEYYLEHINLTQGSISAVIAINPKALSEASRLDSERADGSELGPLHGIPILIKDNIETEDMATTAGSLFLKGNQTGRDAPLVARLKEAGAIILGKANLSEWANFRSTHSSSGWSAMGGRSEIPMTWPARLGAPARVQAPRLQQTWQLQLLERKHQAQFFVLHLLWEWSA